MLIDYPFHFNSCGRTASNDDDKHIRDLIEQVLFTSPSERINRPNFGCGVMKLIFAPNSDALADATNVTVQGALQQWLGDLIQVESVDVRNDDEIFENHFAVYSPENSAAESGSVCQRMESMSIYSCCKDFRRIALSNPEISINGIDFIEVLDDPALSEDRSRRILRGPFLQAHSQ